MLIGFRIATGPNGNGGLRCTRHFLLGTLSGTPAGRIVSMPTREQINLPVQEQLIVELYSK